MRWLATASAVAVGIALGLAAIAGLVWWGLAL